MSRRKKPTLVNRREGMLSFKCWDKCMESFYNEPQTGNIFVPLVPEERNVDILWETSSDTDGEELPHLKKIFHTKPNVVTRLNFDSCKGSSEKFCSNRGVPAKGLESESVLATASDYFSSETSHFLDENCVSESVNNNVVEDNCERVRCGFVCHAENLKLGGNLHCSTEKNVSKICESKCDGVGHTTQDTSSVPYRDQRKRQVSECGVASSLVGSVVQKRKKFYLSLKNDHINESRLYDSPQPVGADKQRCPTSVTEAVSCRVSPILCPRISTVPTFVKVEAPLAVPTDASQIADGSSLLSPEKSPIIKNPNWEVRSPVLTSQKECSSVSEIILDKRVAEQIDGRTDDMAETREGSLYKSPDAGEYHASSFTNTVKTESYKDLFKSLVEKIKSKEIAHPHSLISEPRRSSFPRRKLKYRQGENLLKLPLTSAECESCPELEKTPKKSPRSTSRVNTRPSAQHASPVLRHTVRKSEKQEKAVMTVCLDELAQNNLPPVCGNTSIIVSTPGADANISCMASPEVSSSDEMLASTYPDSPVIGGRAKNPFTIQHNQKLLNSIHRNVRVHSFQKCKSRSRDIFPESKKNSTEMYSTDTDIMGRDVSGDSFQKQDSDARSIPKEKSTACTPLILALKPMSEAANNHSNSPSAKLKCRELIDERHLDKDGNELLLNFEGQSLVKRSCAQSGTPDRQREAAFQSFMLRTINKVRAQQAQVCQQDETPDLPAHTSSSVDGSSASPSLFVIESVSSQEVSTPQKTEASQSSSASYAKKISPVLSQEMKQNHATSSELSTASNASSPWKGMTLPMSPARSDCPGAFDYPDMDSARKKKRKRHKKGSLCARLHRLVGRQRSQANLWQYELSKPTSAWNVDPGKREARSSVLVVLLRWQESGRVMLRCSRGRPVAGHAPADGGGDAAIKSVVQEEENDSNPGSGVNSDVIVVIDPSVVQLPDLQPRSLIRIYPPWQVMEVPQPGFKVIMCLTHVDVVSMSDVYQPPATVERRTTLRRFACPCSEGSSWQGQSSKKCTFKFTNKGAEFMRYIFPEESWDGRCEKLPPQSQVVAKWHDGNGKGTVAEAVQNHNCVLGDMWLLVRIEKIFIYKQARYKLNDSPENEQETSSQRNSRNVVWSLLCRDEEGQCCEVVLGSLPENRSCTLLSETDKPASPGRSHEDELEREGTDTCESVRQKKSQPNTDTPGGENHARASFKFGVGHGTIGGGDRKRGKITPVFTVDRNGQPRNSFTVECNDSEIEFDPPRKSLELPVDHYDKDDHSSVLQESCHPRGENFERDFDYDWFWAALASGKVLQNVYKLSGLTLVKRTTRNKCLGTWALFDGTSAAHHQVHTVLALSEAAAGDELAPDSKVVAAKTQAMFYVFSTCSDVLEVSAVDNSTTAFPPMLHQQVSLLADLMKKVHDESYTRCRLLVKLLIATEDRFYATDASLDREQSMGASCYAVISIGSLCYVPHNVTNGSLLLLKDVLYHKGDFSADRYTTVVPVSREHADLSSWKVETGSSFSLQSLAELKPRVPHLQLTSSDGELVSVAGNVVGVDEDTAFAWPACGRCGAETLAELPSGRHFCHRCCCLVRADTRMSLAVSLSCPALPLRCTARVQLMQKTILELLSPTVQSEEGYDLATVLGQEIGPILCLVDSVKISKSGETVFLLKQVPDICL